VLCACVIIFRLFAKKKKKNVYFSRAGHNLMSRTMILIPIDAHFDKLSNGVKMGAGEFGCEELRLALCCVIIFRLFEKKNDLFWPRLA
jgi:hypothetical protein